MSRGTEGGQMRSGSVAAVLGFMAFSGCTNVYNSDVLWLTYELPSGIKLVEESAGPRRWRGLRVDWKSAPCPQPSRR